VTISSIILSAHQRPSCFFAALVDPERGIVIDYSILHFPNDREMQINEVFKILDGRVRMIDNIGLMGEGIKTSGFTD